MGGLASRLGHLFGQRAQMRILVNGLDMAGKTSILYKLQLGEVVTLTPFIGFAVEQVNYAQVSLTTFDVGGRDKVRPVWRQYYQNTDALIWVVDSDDSIRLGGGPRDIDVEITSRSELHRTLSEDAMRQVPLLVFANKQDLPNSLSIEEITRRLGLYDLRDRVWLIQGCCGLSGDGLNEGLEWLSDAVKMRNPSSKQPRVPAAQNINSISWDQPQPQVTTSPQVAGPPEQVEQES